MDIVKKNLMSIIWGVVAIIAAVLIFYPLNGWFDHLRTKTQESKQVMDDLSGLEKQTRTWPTLSTKEEDKVPLNGFPTEATIKTAENIVKSWNKEANDFLEDAIKLQRDRFVPLVPNVLPSLGSNYFGLKYIEAYEKKFGQFKDPNGDVPLTDTIYTKTLNSTMPPTPEEIRIEQDNKARQITNERSVSINGQISNQEEVQKLVGEATAKVADKLKSDRAYGFSIYADPLTSLTWDQRIAGNRAPAIEAIFDSQLTLWLQEDICRAIAEVNHAPETKIVDAPIKRLHRLAIRHPYQLPNIGVLGAVGAPVAPGAAPAAATPPAELASNPTTKVPANFAMSAFGHISNEFYDVTNFELELTCDAQQFTNVLSGLARGRFLIITNVKIESVDSVLDAVQGYYYGPKPVVHVILQGEYLVLRPVIKPFVPSAVLQAIQAAQPGAQPVQ